MASYTPFPPAGLDTDPPLVFAAKAQAQMEALPILVEELNEKNDGVLIVQERTTMGVAGGSASAGSLNVRKISTVVVNNIATAVVDGSPNFLIQMPAGTYEIEAWGLAYSVGAHRLRLDTWGGGMFFGSTAFAASGAMTESRLTARVTTTAAGNWGLSHLVQNSMPSNGLGYASNLGGEEVYSQLKITRV